MLANRDSTLWFIWVVNVSFIVVISLGSFIICLGVNTAEVNDYRRSPNFEKDLYMV